MATIDQVTIPTATSQPSQWMSGTAVPDASGATGSAPDGSLYFLHDPAGGAQLANAVGVYQKMPPLSSDAPVWRPLDVPGMIDVRRFGAVGDGVTDDSAAFNAAFDAALAVTTAQYPTGTAAVYAPAGQYLVSKPINMTGSQLNLVGDGMFQTVLVGNTGAGNPVIDMTAAGFSSVRELMIVTLAVGTVCQPETPSTYGIVWIRNADGAQMMSNRLERVYVMMHSNASANNGFGTIALYNCGSEVSSVRGCVLRGDSAVTLSTDNFTGFASMYQAAGQNGVSMTVFEADSDTNLVGLAKAPVYIQTGGSIRIESYISCQYDEVGLDTPYPYAVEVVGETNDLYLSGSVETCPISLAIIGAQVRALRYHHYHAHGVFTPPPQPPKKLPKGDFVNTQYFSNVWLDTASVLHSVFQPCPTSQNYDTPGFLIDGVDSTIWSSTIYAYGTQNIRLQTTASASAVLGCVVLTDNEVDDFSIEGSPQVLGTQVVGANGFRPATYGTPRPAATSVAAGTQFYDNTLNKPLWSDGQNWRDASGTVV